MKVRLIISLIFVIFVGVLSFLFLRWANSPVRQTVGIMISPVVSDSGTQDIATNFFATKIPGNFRVESAADPKDADRTQLTAFESQSGKIQIGITSAPLPEEGLAGVADYNYRIKEVSLYEQAPISDFPANSTTFQAKTGEEITTFTTHGNRYASIAISGQAVTSQELVTIRKLVAQHWRWF